MLATDAAGTTAEVYTWHFRVVPAARKPNFQTTPAWQRDGVPDWKRPENNYRDEFMANEPYTLAKPAMSKPELFEDYAEDDISKIAYSLRFTKDNHPIDLPFYINGEGETLAQPKPEHVGRYVGYVLATDAAGTTAEVYTWNFKVVAKPKPKAAPVVVPHATPGTDYTCTQQILPPFLGSAGVGCVWGSYCTKHPKPYYSFCILSLFFGHGRSASMRPATAADVKAALCLLHLRSSGAKATIAKATIAKATIAGS